MGTSVNFFLRGLTGSRPSHESGTRLSRQAGKRVRGTLKFVPLLMFAEERDKRTVGNTVRNDFHFMVYTSDQGDRPEAQRQTMPSFVDPDRKTGVEYTGVRIAMKPVTGKPRKKTQSSESCCWPRSQEMRRVNEREAGA